MLLNAYYFRHHMYSLVPRHVREDMEWMADIGTNVVSIAVLEQDLYAAKWNMEIICREAGRVGMAVHAVPSRWGGLLAGAPKVPSHFTATHPETWMCHADGSPIYQGPQGPLSSVHHPATGEFFRETIARLVTEWPITGVIWDEPKALGVRDYSPMAQAAMPADADDGWHTDAFADFLDMAGAHARAVNPNVTVSMFLYAHLTGYPLERCARIPSLHYFGCDGRPWRLEDGGHLEGAGKVLIGQAERFIAEAKRNGKAGLILIENHNMPLDCYAIMDRRLPEVLGLGAEQVIYYYFPRNLEDPERQMALLARHLRAAR